MAVKLPVVMTSGYPGQIQTGDTVAWSWLSGTPTTVAGYGITDAAPLADPTFTGALSTTGSLGIVQFDNRSGTARTYGLYATSNIIRLWGNTTGDLATVTEAGKLTTVGDIESSGTAYYGDGKNCIQFSDTFLRLNEGNTFTSGIYLSNGAVRGDGTFQMGTTSSNGFYTGAAVAPQWQGIELGYRSIPMTVKNAPYTFSTSDKGKGIYHSDTTGRAYTVPTGFAQGDILTVANETGTGACTIVPGSGMTMYLAGTATTGTRTLAVRGIATIYIGAGGTSCYVSGPGVT